MPRAWISLGANLGRPQATLTAAAKALEQSEGIAHLRLSSFYSTSPVDSSGPDYVNAAAAVDTNCSPEALLKLLQRIEYAHGRVRPAGVRNAPRTLDLDLLAYEGEVRSTDGLTLPHPRMYERLFVLVPLAEIEPNWRSPAGHPQNFLTCGILSFLPGWRNGRRSGFKIRRVKPCEFESRPGDQMMIPSCF